MQVGIWDESRVTGVSQKVKNVQSDKTGERKKGRGVERAPVGI